MGHGDTKSANAAGKVCQQAPPAQGGRKPSVCSSNKKGSVCKPRSSEHAGVLSDVGLRAPCSGWAQPSAGLVASAGRTRPHPDCPGISAPEVASPARPLLISLEF